MGKTRFGIIGHGEAGKRYAAAIQSSVDAEVVATSGPNGAAGDALHFEDAAGLLDRRDLDAVVIACANREKPAIIRSALERNVHVLCDGPPGRDLDDVTAVREAEQASGAMLQFGMPLPAHSSVIKAKGLVTEGGFGAVRSVRAVYGGAGRRNVTEDTWRLDSDAAGGGVLIDEGYQLIDLIARLCGPVLDAKGVISGPKGREESVMATLSLDNGAAASIHVSCVQWRSMFRVEIGLERGYIWLDGLAPANGGFAPEMLISARVRFGEDGEPQPNPPEDVRAFEDDRAPARVLGAFLRTIDGTATPPASGTSDAAFAAMNIVQTLYSRV